jgi:hypothetical protein
MANDITPPTWKQPIAGVGGVPQLRRHCHCPRGRRRPDHGPCFPGMEWIMILRIMHVCFRCGCGVARVVVETSLNLYWFL